MFPMVFLVGFVTFSVIIKTVALLNIAKEKLSFCNCLLKCANYDDEDHESEQIQLSYRKF